MSAAEVARPRRIEGFAWLWNAPLSTARGEAIALASVTALLLIPAIWNRFPIIYYDTGAYLFEGLTGRYIPERAAVYSLFLRFAGGATSLWIIALLQAAMSAFLIAECARALAPGMRVGSLVLIAAALVI